MYSRTVINNQIRSHTCVESKNNCHQKHHHSAWRFWVSCTIDDCRFEGGLIVDKAAYTHIIEEEDDSVKNLLGSGQLCVLLSVDV